MADHEEDPREALERERAEGSAAEHILQSPVAQRVFDAMELRAIREWQKTDRGDAEKRERLYREFKSVEEFQRGLKVLRDRGIVAARQLGDA